VTRSAEPGQSRHCTATERLVQRLGVRYSVVARTAIVGVCGLLGGLVAPESAPVAGAVIAMSTWAVFLATRLLRGCGTWALVVDVLVVSTLCVTQSWTVPIDALAAGQGWVLAVASMTVVGYQWHTRLVTGFVAVVVIDCAFAAGVFIATAPSTSGAYIMICWLPVEAALSRLVWLLVLRGGRAADDAIEHAEGARRSAAVAEAARAAEREYMATLHDTAASTFLMVGLGEVNMAESWLRAQAQRDLQVFDDRGFTSDDEIDLTAMVRDIAGSSRLQVSIDLLDTCVIPATTATAICQAVLEALTNVDRHAHTGAAHVSISSENGELCVAVSDEGSGFLLERVSAERRGISHSIVNRVAAVGGQVSILSAPAAGTTICMVLRR
jgi:hypothetical protein